MPSDQDQLPAGAASAAVPCSPVHWRREPPDRPGFWWCHQRGHTRMVNVWKYKVADSRLFTNEDGGSLVTDGELYHGAQWSGPLEPPPPPAVSSSRLFGDVFVVVIEDRHCDTSVEVWTDRESAIASARALAKEYCRHQDDYQEEAIQGWEFYVRYSCEGDSTRVVKTTVRESPNTQAQARSEAELPAAPGSHSEPSTTE